MRKLLRCKRTGEFLAKDGTWTSDIQKALPLFQSSAPEWLHGAARPQDFEIYFSFDDTGASQYDFTLSVH